MYLRNSRKNEVRLVIKIELESFGKVKMSRLVKILKIF